MDYISIKGYILNLSQVRTVYFTETSICFDFSDECCVGFSYSKDNKTFIRITKKEYEDLKLEVESKLNLRI